MALPLLSAVLLAGCGSSSSTLAAAGGRVRVVAAENFWGSIAGQLGGDRVQAVSIITNPGTDPHSYEPTPQDGRTFAGARYVIVNGAGYDAWADRLLAANPVSGRVVLDVGHLIGRMDGDNPHMWYSPTYVRTVIDRIATDLKALDSADSAYFDQQRATYESTRLKRYDDLRAAIRQAYSGVPVGATESIFVYLADDIGLNLTTPPAYMKATNEGTDPPAADRTTFDTQIAGGQIKVLVFDRQNSTPDIQQLVDRASARGIPVVSITETLAPANVTFQDWQSSQLAALQQALASAAAR
ncbi:MAG: zinc/manganese transport system substrate-binding protein [Chloroflexota bacterium]|nr:zinc/manganese transport system substrate-binding protein [Chloroflexota bacterium]